MREVLQILNDEFRLSMALSGELMIASVSKSLIKHYFCPPLPPQAAGTWRKSTGTSYSFLNSSSPAEGSTEQSSSANQNRQTPGRPMSGGGMHAASGTFKSNRNSCKSARVRQCPGRGGA